MNWMVMPIFEHAHLKIIGITFDFPEFAQAFKKSVHSIYSLLRQSILESCDQTGHTHYWPRPLKYFLVNF